MELRYVAHSEIGLVRKNNQDSGYASPTMLIVADGMGGAAAGDLASAVAIDELRKADERTYHGEDMLKAMSKAMLTANHHVYDLVHADMSLDGMGTTVCGAMFDGEQFGLAHLGDSRGYLWRGGALKRLTHDHSWVQSLVDEGKITEEQALFHPHRSLLLKVLNGQTGNAPDLSLIPAEPGDRIMFCSDGLCGLVEDDLLEEIFAKRKGLDETLDELVAAAHEGGGLDNITIVLADVITDGPASQRPLVLGAANDVEIPVIASKSGGNAPRTAPATARSSRNRVSKPGAPVLFEDPEDARYRPIARNRRRRAWWLAGIALLLALLVGGGIAGQQVINGRYYVGPDGNYVAIYQGVPVAIGPLRLSHLLETTTIVVDDLPPRYAEAVRSNQYQGEPLDATRQTTHELKTKADECAASRRNRQQNQDNPSGNPAAEEGC